MRRNHKDFWSDFHDHFGPRGPKNFHKFFESIFSDFMGRGRRAERGDVRYLILDALLDRPRHGYDIMRAIEDKSAGTYRPSPGVIYPTLQMLEEIGCVTSHEEGGKRIYTITEEGRKDLEAHRQKVDDSYDRMGDDFRLIFEVWRRETGHLIDLIRDLMRDFRRAARRNLLNRDKMQKVTEILRKAVENIEKVFFNE